VALRNDKTHINYYLVIQWNELKKTIQINIHIWIYTSEMSSTFRDKITAEDKGTCSSSIVKHFIYNTKTKYIHRIMWCIQGSFKIEAAFDTSTNKRMIITDETGCSFLPVCQEHQQQRKRKDCAGKEHICLGENKTSILLQSSRIKPCTFRHVFSKPHKYIETNIFTV